MENPFPKSSFQRLLPVNLLINFYLDRWYHGKICFWGFYGWHPPTRDSFAGVSKHVIQEWIKSNRKHCKSHPIFENKDQLQPIIANSPMDMCQIDLVIMEKRPSKWYNSKTYSYVLNIMDVFSRYISLKPLQSKESLEVASHIRQIFFNLGNGNVI